VFLPSYSPDLNPIEEAFSKIKDILRSAVRQWWPPMELVDDGGGERLRMGSTVSFRVHQEAPEVARLAPPFRIHRLSTHGRRGARARRLCARSLLADL
jgi:hypothetical protein